MENVRLFGTSNPLCRTVNLRDSFPCRVHPSTVRTENDKYIQIRADCDAVVVAALFTVRSAGRGFKRPTESLRKVCTNTADLTRTLYNAETYVRRRIQGGQSTSWCSWRPSPCTQTLRAAVSYSMICRRSFRIGMCTGIHRYITCSSTTIGALQCTS